MIFKVHLIHLWISHEEKLCQQPLLCKQVAMQGEATPIPQKTGEKLLSSRASEDLCKPSTLPCLFERGSDMTSPDMFWGGGGAEPRVGCGSLPERELSQRINVPSEGSLQWGRVKASGQKGQAWRPVSREMAKLPGNAAFVERRGRKFHQPRTSDKSHSLSCQGQGLLHQRSVKTMGQQKDSYFQQLPLSSRGHARFCHSSRFHLGEGEDLGWTVES